MKKETVTISKDKLEKLLEKIESLEKKVEELSKEKIVHTTTNSKPVLHSLTAIKAIQSQREVEFRNKIEEQLNKAAELAILDYKRNPPKSRL